MTSKERILKILNFRRPDRIGMYDEFLSGTVEKWRASGFPCDISPQDYFDFDLNVININDLFFDDFKPTVNKDKFTVISFSEPFQKLCESRGRENSLRRLARDPGEFKKDLARETESLSDMIEKALNKGIFFDGAWVWGDMGYSNGLFFSYSWYKNNLLPLHSRLFSLLNSKGLPVLFHSEGMIHELIPDLIDSGVRGLHPFEENSGMDVRKLMNEFAKDMVFIGNMNMGGFGEGRLFIENTKRRIDEIKRSCFYIYSADSPIDSDMPLESYKRALETVKEYGVY